jgi:hypothetical protein
MASWKKVIVSGSNANLTALSVDNLTSGSVVIGGGTGNLFTTPINGTGSIVATTGASGVSMSGSFSGSFQGTISGGNAFIQGGNSFGTTATLGTNDTQNLQIETNGLTRMFISSSGGIGIGTTAPSPSASLHINNTTSDYSLLVEDETNPDSTPFVILDDGRVGIGTKTPNTLLGLKSDVAFSSVIDITNTNANGNAAIDFYSNTTFMGSIGADKSLGLSYDSWNTGDHYFKTSGTTRMFITGSTGYIGIGKTTPNSTLDVNGNTIITGSLTVTNGITGSITASGVVGPYGANSVISSSYAVFSSASIGTLTFGEGLTTGTFNGSGNVTMTVSGAAQLTDNAITKWNNTDNKFVTSSLNDNGTVVSGGSSIQLTGSASSLTGSFTGSFIGDGSGLTGLATTLRVSGSNYSGQPYTSGSISLTTQGLIIEGTQNEVDASVSGQTVTIGLPNDVTIGNNLTVTGDLYVNGTTTTVNTADLYVEDKFILLASGSAAAGDGGIIIDRGSDSNANVAFGFDAATTRWGYQNGLTDSTNAMTIGTDGNSAFAGVVFTEAAHTATKPTTGEFVVAGAIYTNTDGTIWMYS